ncbi:hypothetical protein [Cryobacterium sp. 10C3]|uniref:hypothetical protein n=1 Tax=Cryobacterium sp. 10C3 TaxID=3048577 RepID=UPI002AB4FD69|nr:hypothetical protein [Cryobacterium sp. 10C3]MDY7555508.1 hypothetical protein [Cryobacterium sp. 10C3]
MVFEISAEYEQHRRAGRLREAAQADAALHEVLRRGYPGRHDVLDALWWRAHPLTETPAGRPDPAAELPELQAAVYSRARSPESASEDEQRLAALQLALGRDTADLDALLGQYPTLEAGALAKTGPFLPARVRKVPLSDPDTGTFRTLAEEERMQRREPQRARGRKPRRRGACACCACCAQQRWWCRARRSG